VADLYRTYGGIVYARCRRILGDAQAAEDAAQETFLRLHRHFDRMPDSVEMLRWIYRVATNYCLNQIRDARRRRALADQWSWHEAPCEPNVGLLEMRELMSRVPEKLRNVAWLRYVDGMDQEEVAGVLGISRRTVVTRLAEFNLRARSVSRDAPRRRELTAGWMVSR
jgi:RNA polymerase sigma-70 factor (ECF subfamily)